MTANRSGDRSRRQVWRRVWYWVGGQAGRDDFWCRLGRLLRSVALALIIVGMISNAHRWYRFETHGVRADAVITDSSLGCIGAIGAPASGGGKITYQIVYPVDGGRHRGEVVRPCRVIPPDFGYGRGAIWIEYDHDHPDRVRVVNDDSPLQAIGILLAVLVILLLVPAAAVQVSRLSPYAGSGGRSAGPRSP